MCSAANVTIGPLAFVVQPTYATNDVHLGFFGFGRTDLEQSDILKQLGKVAFRVAFAQSANVGDEEDDVGGPAHDDQGYWEFDMG